MNLPKNLLQLKDEIRAAERRITENETERDLLLKSLKKYAVSDLKGAIQLAANLVKKQEKLNASIAEKKKEIEEVYFGSENNETNS